mmetsp:Transcript_14153/g.24634  ORF Transcript_14153/g.24634 Transcript_14153/m.24634 type:complete len:118 (-) Transcript_14153:102-455(-)
MGTGQIGEDPTGGELSAEALDSLSYKRWLSSSSSETDDTYSYSYEDDSVDDTTVATPVPTLSFSPSAVPTATPDTDKPTPFGISLDNAGARQLPSTMLSLSLIGVVWLLREWWSEFW